MKASDYIVEYLIEKGITDVFGYPGGMITHLMDSFSRYKDKITAHITYNEQGASLAACGYAQVSGKLGVAYATSGPGATNLITGICNAYMDSIPTLFITGQVNSFEQKGNLKVRQRGFQETDIVSMVSSVTKYAARINDVKELKYALDKAFYLANCGRKGPALLDIAMDVTRTEIDDSLFKDFRPDYESKKLLNKDSILTEIKGARRPIILMGNGVERFHQTESSWKEQLNRIKLPVVTSMISIDLQDGLDYYYGFVGAYGNRTANFIVAKSDLVLVVGARLDIRQVGSIRANFAPNSKIIRIDIDPNELEYKVHDDEIGVVYDANDFLCTFLNEWPNIDYSHWINVCDTIQNCLDGIDDRDCNKYVNAISAMISENSIITTDVGQNQVWVAQSFGLKRGQRILFSGGHGTMGYSLPASIGAALASGADVYSFNGDGGIQMNIQELQTIVREQLPIKIIIFNNNALGMIRHFQEMYFNNNFFQTISSGGFSSPNFENISNAYHLPYQLISHLSEVNKIRDIIKKDGPLVVEIKLDESTYVFPKLEFGKPNQDQEPLIDRKLYDTLMSL